MTSTTESVLGEISTVLWRERELLDGLAFRLEMLRLVLADDDRRWLARASRELDSELDALRSAELVRAVRIEILAAELGLPTAPSLLEVAAACSEPWTEIFLQHRRALLDAAAEAVRLAGGNRRLLGDGLRSTRAALERIEGSWGGAPGSPTW
jgi:hypothetical protein